MFRSAQMSIECHWLACKCRKPSCLSSPPEQLIILAMYLVTFCDIMSAMGPRCMPFHLENYCALIQPATS